MMGSTTKMLVEDVAPGMILAEAVRHPVTRQQILPSGTVLSNQNISLVLRAGVPSVLVLCLDDDESVERELPPTPPPNALPPPPSPLMDRFERSLDPMAMTKGLKHATAPLGKMGTGPLGNLFQGKQEPKSERAPKFKGTELESLAKEVIKRNNDVVHTIEATFRQTSKVDFDVVDNCVQSTIQEIILNKELLNSLCDLRVYDEYTYSHCSNVMSLAMVVGYTMGYSLDQLRILGAASLLHDLGKNLIPDFILRKPGKLTDREFDIMKTHPEKGVKILGSYRWATPEIKGAVLYHHEKVNGTGYPKGLAGKDIPEMAKIIAIVDVYDALISDRPYKTAMAPNMAYQIIMEGFNTHFEGKIVWAFQKFIVPYPVNSLVVLNSGEVAKVLKVNRENLLRPIVELDGQTIDLSRHPRLSIVNIFRPR